MHLNESLLLALCVICTTTLIVTLCWSDQKWRSLGKLRQWVSDTEPAITRTGTGVSVEWSAQGEGYVRLWRSPLNDLLSIFWGQSGNGGHVFYPVRGDSQEGYFERYTSEGAERGPIPSSVMPLVRDIAKTAAEKCPSLGSRC